MVWRVDDLNVVDGNDFVAAKQTTVQISGSTRDYVTDRYLKEDLDIVRPSFYNFSFSF